MKKVALLIVSISLFGVSLAKAFDRPSLDGKVDFSPAFFFNDGQVHQSRFDLSLKQTTSLSSQLLTVVHGRVRADPSFANLSYAPGHSFTNDVRNDEGFDPQAREVYLDYLTDDFRLKTGLLTFDWVETLSPLTTNVLTSLDLRRGGQEPIDQILVPTLALNLNHKALGGTLDWILVPLPQSDRLPLGNNGFGYYPFLQEVASPASAVIVNNAIPKQGDQIEGGARYLTTIRGMDLTVLGFYGHQRMPALTLNLLGPNQIQIEQSYPSVATLGIFLTYAADAAVFRILAMEEPGHAPAIHIGGTPTWVENWTRVGLGLDYTFGEFKAYSEIIARYVSLPGDVPSGGGSEIQPNRNDYVATLRITNESIRKVTVALTGTVTAPKFSYSVNPEIVYQIERDFKFAAGGYLVGSHDVTSNFESLKNTSRVYLLFEYLFNLR